MLSILLWTAPSSSAQPALDAKTIAVTCEFQAPQLQAVGGDTRVRVKDCEPLHRVGAPLLPFRTVRLLLPPGGRVEQLTVRTPTAPASIPGVGRVEYGRLPVATPSSGRRSVRTAAADGPDPAIYLSDQPYPPARAEVSSIQRMAGYDIALIRVYPVQYWPMRGEISFAERLELELTLDAKQSPAEPASLASGARRGAKNRVAAFADNPAMLAAYPPAPDHRTESDSSLFDYLLITRSSLVSAFQPLVDLKTQAGLSVKVETVETITAGTAGRDAPEKIRNYIKYAYTNWGITYVLLGGDVVTVPCRYAYVTVGSAVESPNLPTDLYYACLDGSWNSDNDTRWGEPNDGEGGGDVDLLAEVFVGRLPVDTVAEVNAVVTKTIAYQTSDRPRLTNAIFMAETLKDTPTGLAQGGEMLDPLLPLFGGFEVNWLDDRSTTPAWTRVDAINALNQSPHLALFNGHADWQYQTIFGWGNPIARSLEIPDLDSLTNQWPFLAYSVGCDVGRFDDYFWDSIGEEFLKRHNRGAFAAVFNTREGLYDDQNEARFSGEFQFKFFEQLLNQSQTNFGVANQLSKHDMISYVESAGVMSYRWCYYEITLFGDPHLAWRTPQPPAHFLTVTSVHGGATPPVGSHTFAGGTQLTCQVSNSPVSGGAGLQYVCAGWTGSGSVPAAGNGAQVTFTLTQDSAVNWQWTTQAWLDAAAGANGIVAANNGWWNLGEVAAVIAVPARYYHFAGWSGDVPAGQASNATLQLSMDRPRTLVAVFSENRTATGTPEWWLASYGWTNQFEAAAQADFDGDGMAAWKEHVAGTSPVDALSVLKLTAQPVGTSSVRLTWPSVGGRSYSVLRAANLTGSGFTVLTNAKPATPPLDSFTDSRGGLPVQFYQLEVHVNP